MYKIDRREFIKLTVSLSLGLTDFKIKEKSKVVLIRDKDLFEKKGKISKKVLREILERGICLLENEKDIKTALLKNFKEKDIVGIKSNVWAPLPTPTELNEILKDFLVGIGIPEKNIGIDDRGVLKNPIFLNSTKLINARPLRTHNWAGIGGCIKNYIMFVPNPSSYHDNFCSNLGALWKLPIVKDKTKLNILVLFTPQFHSIGPHHFDFEYTWKYSGLLIGKEPVALDAVGLKILKEKRLRYFKREVPLSPPAIHIAVADKEHKIGNSEMANIELIKISNMEEDLI